MGDARTLNGIVIEERDVRCRFNHKNSRAVARYAMSNGCACFPDDREQDLCPQHAAKSEPIGDMRAIIIYQPEVWKWMTAAIDGKNDSAAA